LQRKINNSHIISIFNSKKEPLKSEIIFIGNEESKKGMGLFTFLK